jgi:hypothetical protein
MSRRSSSKPKAIPGSSSTTRIFAIGRSRGGLRSTAGEPWGAALAHGTDQKHLAAMRVCTLLHHCQANPRLDANLGERLFSDSRWRAALDRFERGIAVSEAIRVAALDEAGRRRSQKDSRELFERGVISGVRAEQHTRAPRTHRTRQDAQLGRQFMAT